MLPRASNPTPGVKITAVHFESYKALQRFSMPVGRMNILVGPNNAGKSTVIGAFRILGAALRRARARKPDRMEDVDGTVRPGYLVNTNDLGVSVENVHTDLADTPTTVSFQLSNGNTLRLFFPAQGGSCTLFCDGPGRSPTGPGEFAAQYPVTVGHVPILGPVEYREPHLRQDTIRAALATPRAARHFRNFWYHNPEGFTEFAALVAQTWPGMEIEPPEVQVGAETTIAMFCREARMTRELFWAGFGFQVWCQLLTHIQRAEQDSVLIVDEPEVYLHHDLQRQLIHVLRSTAADIVLATHSAEMLNEAEPEDIVLVDKQRTAARRFRGGPAARTAMSVLGPRPNVQLAQLARTWRVVFIEGNNDILLRRLARRIGLAELANGAGVTFVPLRGACPVEDEILATSETLASLLGGRLAVSVVLDRGFRSDEEIAEIRSRLERHVRMLHVHERHKLENYLLDPDTIEQALVCALGERSVREGEAAPASPPDFRDLLETITDHDYEELRSRYAEHHARVHAESGGDAILQAVLTESSFDSRWSTLEGRLSLAIGDKTLTALTEALQAKLGVTLNERDIVEAMSPESVPEALAELLRQLDVFRRA